MPRSLSPEELLEFAEQIAQDCEVTCNGCWIHKNKPSGTGNKYIQGKFKGDKYYLHRIMACAALDPPSYKPYEVDLLDASHRCDNSLCCNPAHLVLETGAKNRERDCCAANKNVTGYFCPHKPVCLGAQPVNPLVFFYFDKQ